MTGATARRHRVLQIIVDDYVATATPVASMAVARDHGLGVSPATVRKDMVVLAGDGYIIRPHFASGGVPSDKGYRRFIDDLPLGRKPDASDAAGLRQGLGRTPQDVDAWRDTAASIVATLLGTLSFATSPSAAAPRVKQIELVHLQALMVMLVVVLRETTVHRQLLSLSSSTTPQAVEAARNKLAEMLTDRTAQEIAHQRLAGHSELEAQVVRATANVLKKQEIGAVRDRTVQGLGHLFEQPEFMAQPERARDVIGALENDDQVAALGGAAPQDGTPAVLVGGENPEKAFHGLSVVVCRYGVRGEAHGVLGLVGPTRMEYRRALPVMTHTASLLSRFLRRVYGHGTHQRHQTGTHLP